MNNNIFRFLLGALLVIILGLFTYSVVNAQTPPNAAAGQRIAFDYDEPTITTLGINRFEFTFDGVGGNVTTTASRVTQGTFAVAIPALKPGSHTFTVKACTPSVCGDTATFTFNLVIIPAPTNLRPM